MESMEAIFWIVGVAVVWLICGVVALRLAILYDHIVKDESAQDEAEFIIFFGPIAFLFACYLWMKYILGKVWYMLKRVGGWKPDVK